ncbi:MAG: DedA family protein [Alicyclobacillaceae bacterium]|nr:DedA family protein [Alicyclobacillaceae bacterium]
MGDLWNGLVQWLVDYGPAGLFAAMVIEGLGIPFPGDATLAFYGFLASQGHMTLWHLSFAGSLGCLLGSLLAFLLGRSLGPAVQRWLAALRIVPDEKWVSAHRMVDRYGPWVLVFGRFVPGIRALGSYAAGMIGFGTGAYLWWSSLGFASWVGTWVLIGFQLGHQWEQVIHASQRHLVLGAVAAVTVGILWWLWRRRA